jgi:hypothetical protein
MYCKASLLGYLDLNKYLRFPLVQRLIV